MATVRMDYVYIVLCVWYVAVEKDQSDLAVKTKKEPSEDAAQIVAAKSDKSPYTPKPKPLENGRAYAVNVITEDKIKSKGKNLAMKSIV